MDSTSWNALQDRIQPERSEENSRMTCPDPGRGFFATSQSFSFGEPEVEFPSTPSPTPCRRTSLLLSSTNELGSNTPANAHVFTREPKRLLFQNNVQSRKRPSSSPIHRNRSTSKDYSTVTSESNIFGTEDEASHFTTSIGVAHNKSPTSLPGQYNASTKSRNSSANSLESSRSYVSSSPATPNFQGSSPYTELESYDQDELAERSAGTIGGGQDSEKLFSPAQMICWHKVNGVDCKGQQGQNSEARRLLMDHTTSKGANPNHHTLSNPCDRCFKIFGTDEALRTHIRGDVPCAKLGKGASQPENDEIQQTGATPERLKVIKNGVLEYKLGLQTLPTECKGRENELERWVASNTKVYIGQSSQTSEATAQMELGRWFIVVASAKKSRRVLQLLEARWQDISMFDRQCILQDVSEVLAIAEEEGIPERTKKRRKPNKSTSASRLSGAPSTSLSNTSPLRPTPSLTISNSSLYTLKEDTPATSNNPHWPSHCESDTFNSLQDSICPEQADVLTFNGSEHSAASTLNILNLSQSVYSQTESTPFDDLSLFEVAYVDTHLNSNTLMEGDSDHAML